MNLKCSAVPGGDPSLPVLRWTAGASWSGLGGPSEPTAFDALCFCLRYYVRNCVSQVHFVEFYHAGVDVTQEGDWVLVEPCE